MRRKGGALPPLVGVTKRISGSRGSTRVFDVVGVPFTVDGLSLRYDGPFSAFVDVLTPDGEGFSGRATLYGREYGRFELRRADGD